MRKTSALAVALAVMLALLCGVLAISKKASAQVSDPGGAPSSTQNIDPTFVSGNTSCTALGYAYGYKIDNAPFYRTNVGDGAIRVTTTGSGGQYFDWTSNTGVDAVIVKGGPNSDAFVYDPGKGEVTLDTGLHAPTNPNGSGRTSGTTAVVINLRDDQGRLCTWRTVGPESVLASVRDKPEVEAARRAAFEDEEERLIEIGLPDLEPGRLGELFLPLRVRNQVIGVLEVYGPDYLSQGEALETFASLANQAASALENARLYEELTEREHQLHDLVRQLLTAQEEERRRLRRPRRSGPVGGSCIPAPADLRAATCSCPRPGGARGGPGILTADGRRDAQGDLRPQAHCAPLCSTTSGWPPRYACRSRRSGLRVWTSATKKPWGMSASQPR